MAKIIAIHSFRGGTGKSNTTANIAALLAADGRRVGVIDTDIQSPGIHVLFGLVYVILGMGMASIHFALALFNQMREWIRHRSAGAALTNVCGSRPDPQVTQRMKNEGR